MGGSIPVASPCLTPYTFGNETRNDPVLRGDGINNWDMSLAKKTSITEQVGLTFRLEAFNLFNNPRFSAPNTQLNTSATSQFGKVTSPVQPTSPGTGCSAIDLLT